MCQVLLVLQVELHEEYDHYYHYYYYYGDGYYSEGARRGERHRRSSNGRSRRELDAGRSVGVAAHAADDEDEI